MNNNLQLFRNNDFGTLEISIDLYGKEWFPAIQVAAMLGYVNPRKAVIDHCLEDGVTIRDVIDSLGRKQQKKYIDEGNLYRLIIKSTLPSAVKFERWVLNEVLPSIRKHGAYMTHSTIEQALISPDFLIQLATKLKEEQISRKEAEKKIEIMALKAELYDEVMRSNDLLDMLEASRVLNIPRIGRNKLMKILREIGILMKAGQHKNLPYQRYIKDGYFETKVSSYYLPSGVVKVNYTTYVTQKGLEFIRRKVKEYLNDDCEYSLETA